MHLCYYEQICSYVNNMINQWLYYHDYDDLFYNPSRNLYLSYTKILILNMYPSSLELCGGIYD